MSSRSRAPQVCSVCGPRLLMGRSRRPRRPSSACPGLPSMWLASPPQWVAEELLRAEGFTGLEYVTTVGGAGALAGGKVDVILSEAPANILLLDAGKPVVILAGVHGGCYELLGTDRVRTVSDLKGKRVAVRNPGRQAFVASMVSYVG